MLSFRTCCSHLALRPKRLRGDLRTQLARVARVVALKRDNSGLAVWISARMPRTLLHSSRRLALDVNQGKPLAWPSHTNSLLELAWEFKGDHFLDAMTNGNPK